MTEIKDVRDALFSRLYELASKDERVILLTADTGAYFFNNFKRDFPKRFYNVGIAEQNAVSVSAGLAVTGKRVFLFGISNFVFSRVLEQIKIDVCSMNLPVTIIGFGTGYVYPKDGPTHHMTDIISVARTIPNLTVWSPSDLLMASDCVSQCYDLASPSLIYADKGPFKDFEIKLRNMSDGLVNMQNGEDITLFATGIMTSLAVELSDVLQKNGIKAGVVDIFRLKPLNKLEILEILRRSKKIATIEENTLEGGLGGAICEIMCDFEVFKPIRRFGIKDSFMSIVGDRDFIRDANDLSVKKILQKIIEWIE